MTNAPPSLIGTWKLLSFEVWDGGGNVAYPMGRDPVGYAVFTSAGVALIQLARRYPTATQLSPEQQGDLAASFIAYFGRLEHHPSNSEFTVHVEASNREEYVGTRQVRQYSLEGDRLVLGIPGQYQARLVRDRGEGRDADP